MSFIPNFPPSLLAKVSENETGEQQKSRRSKDDYKQMKALEEARKSAAVPAMKDEEGNDINPHIPQYIMQPPWYIGSLQPTLKHQRLQSPEEIAAVKETGFHKWYKRGEETRSSTKAKEYRPGACENCGAMGHKKKDCLERPRKISVKFSNEIIAQDDLPQPELKMDFDSKRDLWNGYDPSQHQLIVQKYQKVEEAKKVVRAKQLEEKLTSAEVTSAELTVNDDDEEDKYGDELDMPGQKFDSKQRQSIRNLRIREDTAKYLYNLNPNSAYYDPKTRSMRENPFQDSGKNEAEVPYAGDNFVRFQGETLNMMSGQVFAWEMYNEHGLDVHLQADPTRLEILKKKVEESRKVVQTNIREEVLNRYGGHEHFDAPPKEFLMAQSELFVEYSRTGHVVKGLEKPRVLSRYDEDVYPNNHTSVWGSYWQSGSWGYKCCHSTIKESYCMGDKNKALTATETKSPEKAPIPIISSEIVLAEKKIEESKVSSPEKKTKTVKRKKKEKKKKHKKLRRESSSSSETESSSEDEKEKRIRKAIELEKARLAKIDRLMKMDERDRPYNSMYATKGPTEEEMEAYRRTRLDPNDPMSSFSK